jgi:hypothetical protein
MLPLACLDGDLKSGASVADLILIMGLTWGVGTGILNSRRQDAFNHIAVPHPPHTTRLDSVHFSWQYKALHLNVQLNYQMSLHPTWSPRPYLL